MEYGSLSGYTDLCKAIHQRYECLKTDRNLFLQSWRDSQEFILPDHGRGLSGTQTETEDKDGRDKMTSIYDSTATAANDVLSAGLLNGLTNETRPWIHLGASDPALDERPNVKSWLYTVAERMRYIHSRSDLYTALHHSYSELGVFGTGPIAQTENFKKVMRFRPFTAGEYYMAADENGDVDTFYRDIYMTSAQIIGKFGIKNVSRQVADSFKNEPDKRWKVIQAIEPNDNRIFIPGSTDWKWRSIYKEEAGEPGKILAVGGHRRFPILAPRWFVVGNQVYGRRCPGMIALPDVKQLQKETEKKLVALDKLVDPPTVSSGVPTEMQINTFPGGHTFDSNSPGGEGLRPLYQVAVPLEEMRADIAGLQDLIKNRFFNHLFLVLQDPGRMTAREVAERHSEKLEMLGPSISRLTNELLKPLVENSLDIMWQAGLIPPAPEELQGQELRVEFDSVLAQAQKMSGIGAIEQFVAFAGSVAGTRPDVMDKIDADELIDVYADRTGVPPSIIVSDEEVMKVREHRAQAAKVQQAIQSGTQLAEIGKTMSQTDRGGNTALSTLQGALPGGAGGLGAPPAPPGK